MSIIPKLASTNGRRDEELNIMLAKEIALAQNAGAVNDLFDNVTSKNKDIQNDCIKVIYEVGKIESGLISPHLDKLLALLSSKNNRLQWGAMTAIATTTAAIPDQIFEALPQIVAAAESGSVITRDYAVHILIQLCATKTPNEDVFSLLIEQLLNSPTNQLPMYAENALPIITTNNKELFINALKNRIDEIEKDSKRQRIEKIIKKSENRK